MDVPYSKRTVVARLFGVTYARSVVDAGPVPVCAREVTDGGRGFGPVVKVRSLPLEPPATSR